MLILVYDKISFVLQKISLQEKVLPVPIRIFN
jgi:hypothetical protein